MQAEHPTDRGFRSRRVGALAATIAAAIAILPAGARAAMVETHVDAPKVVSPHFTTPSSAPSQAPAQQSFGPAPSSVPPRPTAAPSTSAVSTPGQGSRSQPSAPPGRGDPTCDNDCRAIWADYAWDQFVARWTESLTILAFSPSSFLRAAMAAREAKAWVNKVHEIEVEIGGAEKKGERPPKTADSGDQGDDGVVVASGEAGDCPNRGILAIDAEIEDPGGGSNGCY
jgi:hypothetical protein